MSAPELMTVHPENETLAAFLDDRLNTKERREVIEHLAGCDECRTFLNDISDIMAMDEANNVVHMPKRGGWRVAAASVAVAAGLLVVFGGPIQKWVWGRSVEDVFAAGATLRYRPTEGRLSGELAHKDAEGKMRGGGAPEVPIVDLDVPPEVNDALIDLYKAKRPDPHALGVARLMAGQYDEAIPELEKAAKTKEKAKVDLAAALLERGSDKDKDYERALKLSQQSDTPEALWNRAVALGYLNRDKEAIAAWKAYLAVDPTSGWAKEAREEIVTLEQYSPSRLESLQRNPQLRRP